MLLLAFVPVGPAQAQDHGLWTVYQHHLMGAKYVDLPFAVGAPRVQPGPGLIPPGFGPPRPATPFRGPWKRRPTPPANTASLPPPMCCRPISTARSSTRRPTGTSAASCARPRRTRHSPPKAAQIVVPAAGRSQNAYRRCVPARRRPTDGPERAGIATLRQKCSAGGPIAPSPENRSGSEFACSLARTGGTSSHAPGSGRELDTGLVPQSGCAGDRSPVPVGDEVPQVPRGTLPERSAQTAAPVDSGCPLSPSVFW